MKRPATFNPKAEPNDTKEMRDAIGALNAEGVRFARPSTYQLKIDDLSFYPATGSIFRDGDDKAWEQFGLNVLLFHLRTQKRPTGNVLVFGRSNDTDPLPGVDLSRLMSRDSP